MSDREDSIEMLTPDELADRLPLVASNVRVALEKRDRCGTGEASAVMLREIADRTAYFCKKWKKERESATAR